MKEALVYNFEPEKNQKLIQLRNISFEEIIAVLASKGPLDVIEHTNKNKYPNQKMYVVELHEYIYLVPYVREGHQIFLKTAFPSRKATKKYMVSKKEEVTNDS